MDNKKNLNLPLIVLFAFCYLASPASGYTPIFGNSHLLTSGPLNIEVMDPVATDRQDRAVRFSPVAFIIQANYDGDNYFYAPASSTAPPWNSNPNRYPAGSPMEFDLGDFDVRPPGFDEAVFGGQNDEFIKIGVGILRRTISGNYHQNNDYAFVAANTQATWQADRAIFTQTLPRETDTGYRYELETSMHLSGNQLHLEYELTNNGSKSFQTTQYLHNFTAIGDQQPSSASEIEVPWQFNVQGNTSGVMSQQGNKLVFRDNITAVRKPLIPVDNLGDASYEFTVRQTDLDLQYVASAELPDSVSGASAVPLGVSTWNDGAGIQFSPEQFVLVSLDPGSTIAWSRTYTFGVVPEPTTLTMVLSLMALVFTKRQTRRN